MTSVDSTGKSIKTNIDGLIRIDGITAFRRVERDGVIYLQFCDHDRMRSQCRGTKFVEVPLDVLIAAINPPIPKELVQNEQPAADN